ncbi:Ppx/GppA phosphatase family protein [Corynebacterium riegelii]
MPHELLSNIQRGGETEVISGEKEAALSFAGHTADLDPGRGPFCVIDLGGGSTEFVMETSEGIRAVSPEMGCVRITERFMRTDPPTAEETAAVRDYIADRIAEEAEVVPFDQARTFVGCAGTFTTLSALAQDLNSYDPERIHMWEISFDRTRGVTEELRSTTADERRANSVVHPGRADVIATGSAVVEELIDYFERESGASRIVISEKDILDWIVAGLWMTRHSICHFSELN